VIIILFSILDANTLRSDTVLKHKLGTDTAEDEVVYFEKDDTFDVAVGKEKSKNIF
jgi:oligopeptidase B